MMSLLRALVRRFWLCLGLLMVIAGGTAATMGYLAAREAAHMQTLVTTSITPVKGQSTATKSAAGATTKRTAKSPARSTVRKSGGRRAATTRKLTAAAAGSPTTRSALQTITNANAPASGLKRWRGMMWWGGGMLAVGVISVAYSIHEMRPKAPPTGADELLNDAPPF
jgi:hypothetical protein